MVQATDEDKHPSPSDILNAAANGGGGPYTVAKLHPVPAPAPVQLTPARTNVRTLVLNGQADNSLTAIADERRRSLCLRTLSMGVRFLALETSTKKHQAVLPPFSSNLIAAVTQNPDNPSLVSSVKDFISMAFYNTELPNTVINPYHLSTALVSKIIKGSIRATDYELGCSTKEANLSIGHFLPVPATLDLTEDDSQPAFGADSISQQLATALGIQDGQSATTLYQKGNCSTISHMMDATNNLRVTLDALFQSAGGSKILLEFVLGLIREAHSPMVKGIKHEAEARVPGITAALLFVYAQKGIAAISTFRTAFPLLNDLGAKAYKGECIEEAVAIDATELVLNLDNLRSRFHQWLYNGLSTHITLPPAFLAFRGIKPSAFNSKRENYQSSEASGRKKMKAVNGGASSTPAEKANSSPLATKQRLGSKVGFIKINNWPKRFPAEIKICLQYSAEGYSCSGKLRNGNPCPRLHKDSLQALKEADNASYEGLVQYATEHPNEISVVSSTD